MTVEKVAVVTAGGSGIGAAAARRFSRDGYKVAILSSSGKGEALANELGGFGLTGSNQSPADIKKLIDGAVDRWGRIDALVNSAGHGPRGAPASCWRCATTTPPPSSSTAHAASTSSRAAPTTTGARLVNLLPTP